MNNFEIKFFGKYIPEGGNIMGVIHKHFTEVAGIFIFWMSLAFIPSFLYYYSQRFQEFIPFAILEVFLLLVYCKLIYDIFDWYNDVWIIADTGIIDLKWSLFKKNLNTVTFANIEGLEVEQKGMADSLLKKGSLVIHKIGDDNFILENTYKPFNKIDLIEEIMAELNEEDNEASITERRFETIINTLGGMMEGYMDTNFIKDTDNEDDSEKLDDIKEKDGTIDLR